MVALNNTNKKGLGVLLIIFVLMYLLNSMAPMMNEDYFAAFVWPFGVPNLGELPIDAKRVSCFSVFLENTKVYYLTEGGRVPGGMPGSFFSWQRAKIRMALGSSTQNFCISGCSLTPERPTSTISFRSFS